MQWVPGSNPVFSSSSFFSSFCLLLSFFPILFSMLGARANSSLHLYHCVNFLHVALLLHSFMLAQPLQCSSIILALAIYSSVGST